MALTDKPDISTPIPHDGDPIDYECDECGAEPGEQCRPYCIGAWGAGPSGEDEA